MGRDDHRNRQLRATAIPYDQTYSTAAPVSVPAVSVGDVVGIIRAALLALLLVCWVAGAYAGIVYWSLQGSLLGVLVSALIPGVAATSTWWAFTTLEKEAKR